jgi:hypothetical protein
MDCIFGSRDARKSKRNWQIGFSTIGKPSTEGGQRSGGVDESGGLDRCLRVECLGISWGDDSEPISSAVEDSCCNVSGSPLVERGLEFSPLGPGIRRSECGVVSPIGAEHPWPKTLEIPTPLLLPLMLPLPKPLAPSPRGRV